VPHCTQCSNGISMSDEFCPHCGHLLLKETRCRTHPDAPAAGVCIICAEPFCRSCSERVGKLFLCNDHCRYEIYQGMARVYGSSDAVQVDYAKSCLVEAGFHPFVYSRKASPMSLGGPDYMLFNASGEYDGHIVNEFKLMVPCQEVPAAEDTLRHLEILE